MNIEERLLSHTEECKFTGCWNCNYATDSDGYTSMRILGKSEKSHRAAYQLWKGRIPLGMLVCHTCDNPRCINPEHLWLGTPRDNMEDKVRKGRQSKVGNRGNVRGDKNGSRTHPGSHLGERNGRSRLTEEGVRYIRMWALEGFSRKKIAEVFDISYAQVGFVIRATAWGHVV